MQKRFPQMQSLSTPDADSASGFDWNDLKYFLAVARHGGLSRAALQLGTSASTVSRHIGALEKRLNMRLFVRLSTGYLLTDAGSELFDRVAEVERSTQAVERRSSVAGEADKVTGLVRLAASDSMGVHLLTAKLPQLQTRHPGLRVELVLGHTQADLTRREADLALRMMDPAMPGGQGDHVMHRVASVPFSLYAAPSLLQGLDTATLDWTQLPHVSWDSTWRHLPIAQWMARAYADQRPPVFTSNSAMAQMVAVVQGMGVGALPDYLARSHAALVKLPVDTSALARDLWLIYHRDLRSSRRVQAMRQFIEEVLPAALAPA
ncbi:LysR family transcriptional regulator [Aquabacterium sp. CECT 9606]|uniref:LysR family transcriptional regulator n=1 Tax=Aquabacterium sp. CECT 9606 TaxID=2845822 RepID=UPI001E360D76|nr:LysR family transcriptional regulator [Aquabacterium sp. CECT 9606]CAH0348162.1 HTH-type transcriptional regulator CysL [Aquabacterium sp. CECT 9606]